MKYNFWILLSTFFLIGCVSTPPIKQVKIELATIPQISLKAQIHQLDSALWAPDCMFAFGNYLIIEEGKRPSGIFRCFDAEQLNFLFATGVRGKGPNEMMHLLGSYVSTTDTTFSVLDNGIEKELKITDSNLVVVAKTPIMIYDAVNGLVKMDNGSYFMNGHTNGSGSEHLIYKNGEVIECGQYPESSYENQQRFVMEFKTNVARLGGDTIYSFYNNRNLIRKYDFSGQLLEEAYFADLNLEDNNYAKYRNGTCALFTGRACNADSFFLIAFYNGTPNQNIFEGNYDPELLLWDWQKGLSFRLKLDQRYKRPAYTVSEKNEQLYALDLDNPDHIDCYDLSPLF